MPLVVEPEIMPILVAIGALTFVAGMANGATGLGLAILLAAGLALLVDAKTAVILLAIVIPVTALVQLVHHRAQARHARRVLPLFLAGLLGVPFGVALLAILSSRGVALLVGALTLLFVLTSLRRVPVALRPEHELVAGTVVGFLGGVLNGAVGVAGPVLAAYLLALELPPAAFAFLIQALFFSLTLLRLVGLVAIGELTAPLLAMGVLLLVPAMAGQRVGFWLQRRIPPRVFQRLVLAVLFVSGIGLVRRGLGA